MSNIYLVTILFDLNKHLTAEEQDKVWSLMWQFESSLYKHGNILNPSEFFQQIPVLLNTPQFQIKMLYPIITQFRTDWLQKIN